MRKGFKVTLATVAIALLGFKAMAMAPTVSGIPDIIVGDAEDSSDANVFVYPDAFNLDQYVQDDSTAPGDIIWSFTVADPGNSRYRLNGLVGLPDGTDENTHVAPGADRLDTADDDPAKVDSNPRTVTIRDEVASPVAGTPPYAEPGAPFAVVGSEVITLHASDGSTYSAETSKQEIIIYTVNDHVDAYSPYTEHPGVQVLSRNFAEGQFGWSFTQSEGTVQSSTTGGICLEVPLTGGNDGNWASPYGEVELVKNAVYEARLTVTTSQTNATQTPLWMMVYDNAGGTGSDSYGGEMFYLDNEAGRNSPISGIGRDGSENFRFYMAPASYQIPYFQDETNGFFNPLLDAGNDMRLIFRTLDFDSAGYGAELDSGQVCLVDLKVFRIDHDDLPFGPVVFEDNNLTAANWGMDSLLNNTVLTFGGGNATLTSNGNGWDNVDIVLFRPGDNQVSLDGSNPSLNQDNWPIAVEADTAYFIEYEVSAPSQTAEENPVDVLRVGADVMTQELVTDHFLVPNVADLSSGVVNPRGIVMPRMGGPYKYACIFYSHTPTGSSIPQSQIFRPRFEVLNSNAINPLGRTTNAQGGVTIHSVKVTKLNLN